MTNSEQALRELLEKHKFGYQEYVDFVFSDLTALISEHYVAKAAYIALENTLAKAEAKNLELLQQRDELKEALLEAVKTIRIWHGFMEAHPTEMKAWEYYQQSPEMKKINAAIKNTER